LFFNKRTLIHVFDLRYAISGVQIGILNLEEEQKVMMLQKS